MNGIPNGSEDDQSDVTLAGDEPIGNLDSYLRYPPILSPALGSIAPEKSETMRWVKETIPGAKGSASEVSRACLRYARRLLKDAERGQDH